MKRILETSSIFNYIQEIKNESDGFIANFFPNKKNLGNWIHEKRLFFDFHPKCLFLLRKDKDFFRVYFFSSDTDSLGRSLQKLSMSIKATIVIDLVSKFDISHDTIAVLKDNSFKRYAVFFRMINISDFKKFGTLGNSGITFAQMKDNIQIYQLLGQHFDQYSEAPPTLNEISDAIKTESILIINKSNEITALLYFDRIGHTNILRYWYVNNEYRGQKLGSRIIRRYFFECKNEKKIFLWVERKKMNTIAKYQHYGFKFDGLKDYIYKK